MLYFENVYLADMLAY